MPQLVQALTFESQHYSVLGEFLLDRALQNPFVVGFALYSEIKTQLKLKLLFERVALILEQFVMLCGSFRTELMKTHHSSLLLEKLTASVARNVPLDQAL
jgi:phosphatidylinositol-4,5-bisphosphate 3-kinase